MSNKVTHYPDGTPIKEYPKWVVNKMNNNRQIVHSLEEEIEVSGNDPNNEPNNQAEEEKKDPTEDKKNDSSKAKPWGKQ